MSDPSVLPDPDDYPSADVVIYDGDCNFCKQQVRNLHRLDRFGTRLSFISLHDPRVSERYPQLTFDQLMEQMYVVSAAGNSHAHDTIENDAISNRPWSGIAYGGADAVRYLSRRLPLLWPFAPILHLPGTARLWRWFYHQIAKRRYMIAGKAQRCEQDACSIHLR